MRSARHRCCQGVTVGRLLNKVTATLQKFMCVSVCVCVCVCVSDMICVTWTQEATYSGEVAAEPHMIGESVHRHQFLVNVVMLD